MLTVGLREREADFCQWQLQQVCHWVPLILILHLVSIGVFSLQFILELTFRCWRQPRECRHRSYTIKIILYEDQESFVPNEDKLFDQEAVKQTFVGWRDLTSPIPMLEMNLVPCWSKDKGSRFVISLFIKLLHVTSSGNSSLHFLVSENLEGSWKLERILEKTATFLYQDQSLWGSRISFNIWKWNIWTRRCRGGFVGWKDQSDCPLQRI